MTPAQQLATFINKYDPKIAAFGRRGLTKMRAKLPGATELVYDNCDSRWC